jgi:hypothetical protein
MQGLAIRRIAQLGQIANPLRAEDALGYSQCEAVDRSGQSGQYGCCSAVGRADRMDSYGCSASAADGRVAVPPSPKLEGSGSSTSGVAGPAWYPTTSLSVEGELEHCVHLTTRLIDGWAGMPSTITFSPAWSARV